MLSLDNDPFLHQCNRYHETRTNRPTEARQTRASFRPHRPQRAGDALMRENG